MESLMQDDVTYNQIIILRENTSLKCKQVKKSFTEKGQLILILEDSKKITISGKNIDASGQRSRINELVSMSTEKGFDIQEKSVKHYAKIKDDEYVLIRW
jgi:hypothetical protein